MNNRLPSILFISVCLVACRTIEPDTDGSVYLSASVQEEVMSRAPFQATSPSTTSQLSAAIWASTTKYSYPDSNIDGRTDGTVATHTSAIFQSGDSQLVNNVYYKADAVKTVYFTAMHPQDGWTVNDGNNKALFTFDGSHDVMFAPQTSGSYNSSVPQLHFLHLLTWLKVSIKAESEAARDAWGKITHMILSSKKDVAIDLSKDFTAGNVTFEGDEEDLNFYSSSTDEVFPGPSFYQMETTFKDAAYILCAPVDATTHDPYAEGTVRTPEYNIRIVSEHRDITIPVDLMSGSDTWFAGSTSGKQFTLNLNFKIGNTIAVSAAVSDWQTGGIGIGKIEE